MIWESVYWKEPLLKSAAWLRSVRLSGATQERTLVKIEKEIFIGFYSIRKLLETLKVTDSTKNKKFELEWFQNSKKPNYLNWYHIERFYDLTKSNKESRDIGYICNLFIHSYVFLISGEGKIYGSYVSTDKLKNKKLYFVSLNNILSIFRLVGRDYPSSSQFVKKPETCEFKGKVW